MTRGVEIPPDDASTLVSMINDHFLEYGVRTSLVLAERFRVLLVSPGSGGAVISVQEEVDESKMEFWFHVLQAPCRIDPSIRRWRVGSAMGVQGSLHVFYEAPDEHRALAGIQGLFR